VGPRTGLDEVEKRKLYTYEALHQRIIKIEIITGEMKYSVWRVEILMF
jgi:hypothetical protein